jgi:DNA-binding NarL/FixJ family response regulator
VSGALIRIAQADDQPLFSAGLKMILRSQTDMDLVGEAVNGEAAVILAHEAGPDVLLMDIRMPVMDGITATRKIPGIAGACIHQDHRADHHPAR